MADSALPATMSQDDPWAWQAWAAQREPEIYGWKDANGGGLQDWAANTRFQGYDPSAEQNMQGFMQEGGSSYAPDPNYLMGGAALAKKAGYTSRYARGPGYSVLQQILDPEGNVVHQSTMNRTNSLHGKDYAMFASVLAAGLGGAAYGAGAGGAGAGAAATAGAAGAAAGASATTFGLTATQWAALQTAASSGLMTAGATNALQQLQANGWDIDELDMDANAKAALRGAATGVATSAIGGAVNSVNPAGAVGLNGAAANMANGALTNAATTAVVNPGADSGDYLRAGANGALQNMGSPTGNRATDAAIRAGGRTLINGGNLSGAITSAATGALNNYVSSPSGGSRSNLIPGGSPTYDVDLVTPGINDNPGAPAMDEPVFDLENTLNYGMPDPNVYFGGSPTFNEGGGGALVFGDDITGPQIGDFPEDPGNGDAPADYSNEGRNYPTPESTQGPGGSPVNSTQGPGQPSYLQNLWNAILGGASQGGASQGGNNNLASNSQWLASLMGLFGAGMQQYSAEKISKENREYQEKLAAEKRRRQMPVNVPGALTAGVVRGMGGTARLPQTPDRSAAA